MSVGDGSRSYTADEVRRAGVGGPPIPLGFDHEGHRRGNHGWSKGGTCLRCKLQRRTAKRQAKAGVIPGSASRMVDVIEYSIDGVNWHEQTMPACRL